MTNPAGCTISSRTRTIAYWVTTVIIAAELAVGGVWDILRAPYVRAVWEHLGYPTYFLVILGVWKVPGAVALLVPRFPRLKEWAYAGTFFELTGAVASHAASGSSAGHLIWPGFFAVCTIVSWALRPQSRTLGVLFPAKMWWPTRLHGEGSARWARRPARRPGLRS